MTNRRLTCLLFALTSVAALADSPPADVKDGVLSGSVEERVEAPGYTYLKVKTAVGSTWAAVPSAPQVKVGQQVAVQTQALMQDFESKTLKRTFARIWFGTLGAGATPTGDAKPLPPGHPPTNAAAPALPAGHPALPAEADAKAAPAATPPAASIVGTIDEVIQVPSYTYLRLSTRSGAVWAAVQTTQAKVGDKVALQGSTLMENFESKALKRRFERIYFANGLTPAPLSF